jgi:hypothetical protein
MADSIDMAQATANHYRTLPRDEVVQKAMNDYILGLETKLKALNRYVSSSCLRHNSHGTQFLRSVVGIDL